MKLFLPISRVRARTGVLLMECLVYIGLLVIILNLAMVSFYLCWDNSKALTYATDDIASALRAGERWRADVRSATGKITVETTPQGENLRIPRGKSVVLYSFSAGEIHRRLASSNFSESLLTTVRASQMVSDSRGAVNAWKWELQLKSRRKETHLPMLFTFEVAAKTMP